MAKQHLLLSVVGIVLLMMLPSCLNDDDSSELLRPTALVTVCPNADGSFIMQLDDETQLVPTNLKSSPFGTKEVRALVNYTETNVSPQDKKQGMSKSTGLTASAPNYRWKLWENKMPPNWE